VVAAECLGELRRLAVADLAGDVADGSTVVEQHLAGAIHAYGGQVGAEAAASGLVEDALELTGRGPDRAGDLGNCQRLGVAALYLTGRIQPQLAPAIDRSLAYRPNGVHGVSFVGAGNLDIIEFDDLLR
jgi:hypothetical protein